MVFVVCGLWFVVFVVALGFVSLVWKRLKEGGIPIYLYSFTIHNSLSVFSFISIHHSFPGRQLMFIRPLIFFMVSQFTLMVGIVIIYHLNLVFFEKRYPCLMGYYYESQ